MNLPFLKSLWAFVVAVTEGTMMYVDDNQITSGEVPLIIATVAGLIGVYFIPNIRDGMSVDRTAKAFQRQGLVRKRDQ